MLHRRSFLRGLIAAPIVARADNLMKLRGVLLPLPSVRWLATYDIGSDREMIRVDVLYGQLLKLPQQWGKGIWEVPEAWRKTPLALRAEHKAMLMALKNPGVQYHADFYAPDGLIGIPDSVHD